MGLKSSLLKLAQKTVLRSPYIRYCSQTIYEVLLGCIRMHEATGLAIWRQRAANLVEILQSIQQPDGGFDIGYDFNFGAFHKKGQSTSPELVGLLALVQYANLFGKEKVYASTDRAVSWIKSHAIDMGESGIAIPYGPYSRSEVMVYNGTSFATGALGCYLGYVGKNEELEIIYKGMIKYLNSVLTVAPYGSGRFWYYNDQSRSDLEGNQRFKVDNYHQMQQVEMHALAEKALPVKGQLELIRDATDYICLLGNQYDVIPYYNENGSAIHVWGLSSVVSGMLEAATLLPQREADYKAIAHKVMNWLIRHSWNGRHFIPILDKNGGTVFSDYMVRSDAWVFNAFCAAQKFLGAGYWSDIIEKCFEKMESVDFSGPESNASTNLKRLSVSIYKKIKK